MGGEVNSVLPAPIEVGSWHEVGIWAAKARQRQRELANARLTPATARSRTCEICESPVGQRQRFCPKCARKRTLASKRRHKRAAVEKVAPQV